MGGNGINEDGSEDSVSDQSNIIPTFGLIETTVPKDKYYWPSQGSSNHQIVKRSGGFSIFSLLNFMLVVLNIVIDINNNINNNNNNVNMNRRKRTAHKPYFL